MISGTGLGTADGIVVQSAPSLGSQGATLALWNPAGRAATVVGRAAAVLDAYTPPGARYSLLAWLPDGTHLIAGPMTGASYLVDSATLSAEPLMTGAGAGHRPGPDINYTTAVIPRKP